MNNLQWKFDDHPNTAVIANRKIFSSGEWIAYVFHDNDDGCWQFHTDQSTPLIEEDAILVSLQSVVNQDHSIAVLADLPLGWCAWRNSIEAIWQKAPKTS